jgi:hypothetical protein
MLLAEYKKSLKMIEAEETFDLYFYRPLAFLLVKAIYNTRITPNQLTLLSMLFGLLGGASYAFGSHAAYIAGAVLYCLYNILDCSDGQLARLKNNGTRLGRILDGIADYLVTIAVYAGIGIGFASNSPHPVFWWILTVAAGISNGAQSMIFDYYRGRFLDYVLERVSTFEDGVKSFRDEYEDLKRQKGKRFARTAIWIYLQYSFLQRKLISHRKSIKPAKKYDPEEYYRINKVVLHLWSYLGPTTQFTFLIVTSLINRLDIYLWGLVAVGNIWALVMFTVQNKVNSHLHPKEAR